MYSVAIRIGQTFAHLEAANNVEKGRTILHRFMKFSSNLFAGVYVLNTCVDGKSARSHI